MLPSPGRQNRFAHAIDEKQLMIQRGINDFTDPHNRNAFNLSRQFRCDDDQFVLLAAMECMGILSPAIASERRYWTVRTP